VSQRRGRATVFWRASCRARAVMREDAEPSGREDQLREKKREKRGARENFSDGQPALLRRSGAACGIRKQTA
jgi:hypothetical protein